MSEKVISYEGDQPYIFVSYAHKDIQRVMKVLSVLDERGYRVWYDDGIAPGSEWPEYIATHLDQASAVLSFITDNSVNSSNCRREITFALSRNKPFVSVFLEKTELPLGLELQISAQQSVLRYNFDSDKAFLDRLCSTPFFQPCRRETEETKKIVQAEAEPAPAKTEAEPAPEPMPAPAQPEVAPVRPANPPQKNKMPIFAGIGVAAVIAIVIAVMMMGGGSGSGISSGGSAESTEVGADGIDLSGVSEYITIENKTISVDTISRLCKLQKLDLVTFENCTFDEGAMTDFKLMGSDAPMLHFIDCKGLDDLGFLFNHAAYNELSIINCGLTDAVMPDLSELPVEYLDLSGNAELTKVSLNMEAIRTLDVSETGITDISFMAGADRLYSLDLHNSGVSDLSPLVPLTSIRFLNLSGIQMDAFDIELNSLKLEEIRLNGCGLTSTEGLEDYAYLTSVDLGNNSLTDVSFLSDLAGTLEELDISGNDLKAESLGWLENATKLKKLTLDHLDLSECQLSFAKNMKELEYLSARDCGLTDVSGIKDLEKIRSLLLGFNEISDIAQIGFASKNAPRYEYFYVLDLVQNQVTDISPLADSTQYNSFLLLVGNPIGKYPQGDYDMNWSSVVADYFEGIEDVDFHVSSNFSIAGCPRKKMEVVSEKQYYAVFNTREEQLELIKSKINSAKFEGFEDAFLAIPVPAED